MAKQHLHLDRMRPIRKQVCCTGAANSMRRDGCPDPGIRGMTTDNLLHA